MADNQKRYCLQLREDFFDSEEIKIIESLPNGYLYLNILLKLYLLGLKNNGRLIFKGAIPYSPEMIASIIRHDVNTVNKALEIFQNMQLIEVSEDGIVNMLNMENLINKSYNKSIEENSDDNRKSITIPYEEIKNLYNSICVSFPKCTNVSEARKKAIKARFSSGYTLEDFELLFNKAESSPFLKGQNNRNWTAKFDWLIKDANMAKVLDGNYDNLPNGTPNNPSPIRERIGDLDFIS